MSPGVKKTVKRLFVIAAIAVIVWIIDVDRFVALLRGVSPYYFALVVFVVLFDQVYMGAKWHYLLGVFHVKAPLHAPVMAYLRGRIFSFVAPSSLGLDAYKAYCIKRYHDNLSSIVSSILVERSFGLLSSLSVIALLFPFCVNLFDVPFKEHVWYFSIAGFVSICIVLHLIQYHAKLVLGLKFPRFFPARAHDLLEKLVGNLAKVKDDQRKVWVYFFLSIIEKGAYGTAVYFSARSLGLTEPGYMVVLAAAPVIAMLERLPISVSAIGVREGLFVGLFSLFYNDPTIALTVSLILRAAEVIQILLFSLTWLWGGDRESIEKRVRPVEAEMQDLGESDTLIKNEVEEARL